MQGQIDRARRKVYREQRRRAPEHCQFCAAASRRRVAHAGSAGLTDSFVRDGATILAYSYSRVVLHALLEAARKGKRFRVLVPESRPDGTGCGQSRGVAHTALGLNGRALAFVLLARSYLLARQLRDAGVPVQLIVDAAVAHVRRNESRDARHSSSPTHRR